MLPVEITGRVQRLGIVRAAFASRPRDAPRRDFAPRMRDPDRGAGRGRRRISRNVDKTAHAARQEMSAKNAQSRVLFRVAPSNHDDRDLRGVREVVPREPARYLFRPGCRPKHRAPPRKSRRRRRKQQASPSLALPIAPCPILQCGSVRPQYLRSHTNFASGLRRALRERRCGPRRLPFRLRDLDFSGSLEHLCVRRRRGRRRCSFDAGARERGRRRCVLSPNLFVPPTRSRKTFARHRPAPRARDRRRIHRCRPTMP